MKLPRFLTIILTSDILFFLMPELIFSLSTLFLIPSISAPFKTMNLLPSSVEIWILKELFLKTHQVCSVQLRFTRHYCSGWVSVVCGVDVDVAFGVCAFVLVSSVLPVPPRGDLFTVAVYTACLPCDATNPRLFEHQYQSVQRNEPVQQPTKHHLPLFFAFVPVGEIQVKRITQPISAVEWNNSNKC